MTSENRDRRLALSYASIGRRQIPTFKSRMNDVGLSNLNYELLPLLESEPYRLRLLEAYESLTKKGRILDRVWKNKSKFQAAAEELAQRLSPETVFVYFQNSDYIGAMATDVSDFFSNAVHLVEVYGEEIYASDAEFKNGIVVDIVSGNVETSGWGNDWILNA